MFVPWLTNTSKSQWFKTKQTNKQKKKDFFVHTIYLLGVGKEEFTYCSNSAPEFLREAINLNFPNPCDRREREYSFMAYTDKLSYCSARK